MTTFQTPDFHLPKLGKTVPAAAKRGLHMLQSIQKGCLHLTLPDGQRLRFGKDEAIQAHIQFHNWHVFGAALRSGDIGFAESFMAGDWDTPDLTALLQLLVINRRPMDDMIFGTWWGRLAYQLRHWMRRNTKKNSSKNIHAHYDLGNAFYSLWLDPSMTYSSAWFDDNRQQDLQSAQHAKLRRALRMAGVQPGARVLEIGCGWGGLAELGAAEFGAHMTGITLSPSQLAFAKQRLDALALSADLRLQDYRDTNDGPFDAICSIEMIEAVGRDYWPTYFQTIAKLLKPGGRACVQSIVIDDALFERYALGTDFIQQYIFPGGFLPSQSTFIAQAQAAGLEVVDQLAFGLDYAETLKRWRESFLQVQAQMPALGFDLRFERTWLFYLAYCEAAFLEHNTDVVQFTLRQPA
ncbi:MAG: class I SAM-dependent methyltransferase [Betaproteobacteria bacterium]|nr:class I SAM-dependent methyltransferase [Betaproteobacteria bacterium]